MKIVIVNTFFKLIFKLITIFFMKKYSTVVVHEKYSNYLKTSLEITSKYNHIYLIGNKELASFESENITFVDIKKYLNIQLLKTLKENFVNYGAKDNSTEIFWFSRLFIINEFLSEYCLDGAFCSDSDNILLQDINEYPFTKNNALCISKNWHPNYLTASIHSALISKEFCEEYIKLYFDIFINKSKFNLIENKINFHKKNSGGIADMTIYYLMYSENIVEVQNLLEPVVINNIKNVFINNISNQEGYMHQEQYIKSGKYLKIKSNSNGNFIFDSINGERLNLMNIHFQGKAKKKINNLLKFKLTT